MFEIIQMRLKVSFIHTIFLIQKASKQKSQSFYCKKHCWAKEKRSLSWDRTLSLILAPRPFQAHSKVCLNNFLSFSYSFPLFNPILPSSRPNCFLSRLLLLSFPLFLYLSLFLYNFQSLFNSNSFFAFCLSVALHLSTCVKIYISISPSLPISLLLSLSLLYIFALSLPISTPEHESLIFCSFSLHSIKYHSATSWGRQRRVFDAQ